MASQNYRPEFTGQRPNEEVLMIIYRHWYAVVMPAIKALIIIVLSFFIPLWLNFGGLIFSYAISTTVYYLWIVFWIAYIVHTYFNWLQDKFIVTNQRILDIDQRGMFRRRVAEVELGQIGGITHETVGFFPTLFNFGTLIIQGGGADGLVLKQVANPAMLKEDIIQLAKTSTR